MMLDRIGVVFHKEVLDNLRDRKTIAGSLFYPLVGPLMLLLVFTVLAQTISAKSEQALFLPVIGAEHAPALVQFLEQNGAAVLPGPADAEAEVRAGNLDVVLVIPHDYGDDFTAGVPATARLIADESRQSASVSIRRAKALLLGYNAQIGNLRLLARGIDPRVVQPLAIEETDVATPQSQAALFLNMLPYFVIFSIFVGAMYLVIDAIAGERERGSLEPLLTNPIPRALLLIGKVSAALAFGAVSLVETVIAFSVVLRLLPTESWGLQVQVGLGALAGIFLIGLPVLLLATSLQMVISTFTRSFKEAQNYLGLLPLVPALPGMALAFLPLKVELWMMFVPTVSQQVLMIQILRGEILDPLNVVVAVLSTLLCAILLLVLAIRLYSREQVLVGR